MLLQGGMNRHEDIQHGLGANIRFAALLHHPDSFRELAFEVVTGLGSFGHAHQEAAIERP